MAQRQVQQHDQQEADRAYQENGGPCVGCRGAVQYFVPGTQSKHYGSTFIVCATAQQIPFNQRPDQCKKQFKKCAPAPVDAHGRALPAYPPQNTYSPQQFHTQAVPNYGPQHVADANYPPMPPRAQLPPAPQLPAPTAVSAPQHSSVGSDTFDEKLTRISVIMDRWVELQGTLFLELKQNQEYLATLMNRLAPEQQQTQYAE